MSACDLLVIGSGAAGLTAALTAAEVGLTVVVEKAPVLGGTTALSEGMIRVPCSRQAHAAGHADTEDAALACLAAAAGNHLDRARAEAYVRNAAAMLAFVEAESAARYLLVPGSIDYHQELPGALAGGRALRPDPFDGRTLGREFARLRPPLASTMILGGMTIASADLPHVHRIGRSPRSLAHMARITARYLADRARGYRRGTRIAGGNGLVAALMHGLGERGVPLWTGARVTRLLMEQGRVAGAVIERAGKAVTIAARRGIVLATGGFPGDAALTSRHYPHVAAGKPHHSLAPATNCGDGLRLALELGAALDDDAAQPAAWTPVSLVPVGAESVPFPHYLDRGKPGVIAVDRRGRRFTNEADSYHAFVPAMIEACRDDPAVEAFLIADAHAVRRYGLGAAPPWPGRLGQHLRTGCLARGGTPADLAGRLGIDPAGLAATIADFNRHAAIGQDPAFGKGSTAYNRANGDPEHGPNPCLAPLADPPYFAVRLLPGDIATFIGLKTDAHARVLTAAGNDMTTAMGGTYPAAGITIGSAMTFGYVAARHIAGLP